MTRFGTVLFPLLVVVALMQHTSAQPKYSEWSAPQNLGAVVNSAFDDDAGALSKNGLSLYFTSGREGGLGGDDLWVSQRASTDELFGEPENLGDVINTGAAERTPTLSRDGHWLLFASNRGGGGGFGGLDIWASYRQHTNDDSGWQTPVNLGAGINTVTNDTGPTYLEGDDSHGARIYFARTVSRTNLITDIWVSEQGLDGTWGTAMPVEELNTDLSDAGAEILHDGLEIFFHSDRSGPLGGLDIWTATRKSVDEPFSPPEPVVVLNSASTDRDPGLSSKGDELFLASNLHPNEINRTDLDLYVSTRVKSHK